MFFIVLENYKLEFNESIPDLTPDLKFKTFCQCHYRSAIQLDYPWSRYKCTVIDPFWQRSN